MERTSTNTLPPGQTNADVLQAFSDLNLILDAKGIILDDKPGHFVAPRFSQPLRGLKIQDVLALASVDAFEQALQSVQQTSAANGFECKLPFADREYWFDARLIPLADSPILICCTGCHKMPGNRKPDGSTNATTFHASIH